MHDQDTFAHLLPTGATRNLVMEFVNIHSQNVFIPWDTHKRHLNPDREIMRALTKNKLITDFFRHWYQAYQGIGRGDVTDLISEPLPKAVDKAKSDLFLPTRLTVDVDLHRKRGVNLPQSYIPPRVNRGNLENNVITIKFTVDTDEAMYLFGKYGLEGSTSEPSKTIVQNLSEAIRDDVLDRAKRGEGRLWRNHQPQGGWRTRGISTRRFICSSVGGYDITLRQYLTDMSLLVGLNSGT